MELNILHCGDCLEILKTIPDKSIDLTVTSPPYDNLRDYKGYTFDFEGIAKELYRVTKEGGVVVWVVGDSMINGSKSLTSYTQCIFFKQLGFNVFDVIIYEKTGTAPPHKGRYFSSFEYMFVLSKGKPKTVNLIKDRKNIWGGTETFGNVTRREADGTLTDKGKKTIQEYSHRTNIWKYTNGKTPGAEFVHPAVFPEKLAEDHILSWSNEGDTILDPFAGSGTTLKMAQKNNRNYIGIEISEEYCEIIKNRLNNPPLFLL